MSHKKRLATAKNHNAKKNIANALMQELLAIHNANATAVEILTIISTIIITHNDFILFSCYTMTPMNTINMSNKYINIIYMLNVV